MRQRRFLASRRLMTPTPRRDLDQSCGRPRKSTVPFPGSIPWGASGFLNAINAVCGGCRRRPQRANRLGSTAMLLRASPSHSPPMTQSRVKEWLSALRRRLSVAAGCPHGRASRATSYPVHPPLPIPPYVPLSRLRRSDSLHARACPGALSSLLPRLPMSMSPLAYRARWCCPSPSNGPMHPADCSPDRRGRRVP